MDKKEEIYLYAYIRLIITIIILYCLNIPIFMKILLIILADCIDYIPLNKLLHKSKSIRAKNESTYQVIDKINDTICYTLLLFYILKNGGMSSNYNYLIILLFIYRLIGVYLFLINNNRKYLFYFPNFFLEISLGIMIINYFQMLKKFKVIIFLIIVIYKIIQEYYVHIFRNI